MPKRIKHVRDLRRVEHESVAYREIIEVEGWTPHVLRDNGGVYWDALTVRDRSGKLVNGLSDTAKNQLVKMILDGYFGEHVKDAVVAVDHYWKIRDALDFPETAPKDYEVVDLRLPT